MQQLIVLKTFLNIFKSISYHTHCKCMVFISERSLMHPDKPSPVAGHFLVRRSGGEHLPGTFFSLDGARDQVPQPFSPFGRVIPDG